MTRTASTAVLAALATALTGGLLASLPLLLAWEAAAYVGAWLGVASIDPTWNDGDAALAFAAAAVVVLVMAATGCAVLVIARRNGLPQVVSAGAGLLVAAAVAVLPSTLFLHGN